MKRREHKALPNEILQEFQNGTPKAQQQAIRVWDLLGELEDVPLEVPSTDDALNDLVSRIDADAKPSVRKRAPERKPIAKKTQQRYPTELCVWNGHGSCPGMCHRILVESSGRVHGTVWRASGSSIARWI